MPVYVIADPHHEIFQLGHLPNGLVDVNTVTSVAADGAELDVILKHIHNLPYTDHYVQVWFGDLAKFVYRAIMGLPGFVTEVTPLTHKANMEKLAAS